MAHSRLGVLVLLLAAASACSTTERAFGGGSGGGAPSATSTSGSTMASPSSGGTGGDGGGDPGAGGSGGAPAATSSSGGGGPGVCGNGVIDQGEECDQDTSLCTSCRVECPEGWFEASGSCFMVLPGSGGVTTAFPAAAQCGALDTSASGHRARLASPRTASQFEELATRCTNFGCWLGYYDLGDPAAPVEVVAGATGEPLPDAVPWAVGEPVAALRHVCMRLDAVDVGGGVMGPALSLGDCIASSAGVACELAPDWGSVDTCGDAVLDPGEECANDVDCLACDRVCPPGWTEDPIAHQCYLPTVTPENWNSSQKVCLQVSGLGGARLATPDDPADARIAQFAATGPAWIGLQVLQEATWLSGEPFDYEPGQYPLSGGAGAEGDHGSLVDGQVVLVPVGPGDLRIALCELHDPG